MSGENDISDTPTSKTETSDGEDVDNIQKDTICCEGESKKMTKKHLRKLRRHEQWLEKLPEKRAKEKERKKQRRQEARERGETLGPTRKMLKLNSMEKSSCKVNVVLDCSFESYMGDRDIMKLTKQVGFCYSVNRRAKNPLQFYVSGVEGRMKERLESVGDYKNWDVNFTEKHFDEVFDKDKIVYLTSDSPNTLDDLSEDHAYIIGGLVDHNHYKGLCYQMAEERNLAHAQLPIGEYVTLKSRRILTVNHVFEILLKYTETKDWKASFFSIIPQRKVEKDEGTTCIIPQRKVEKDENTTCSQNNKNDTGETDTQKCTNNETDFRTTDGEKDVKKSSITVKDGDKTSAVDKSSNNVLVNVKSSDDILTDVTSNEDILADVKSSDDILTSVKESKSSVSNNDTDNVKQSNTPLQSDFTQEILVKQKMQKKVDEEL